MKWANNVGMVYKVFDWFKRSEKYYKNGDNRVSRSSQSSPCLSCRKGFTLVELIVVLVILAILAAVSIPAMLGFIDASKDKERSANAESARKASQTVLTDIYNNCSNTLSPELRLSIREKAGHMNLDEDGDIVDDGTAFWITTGKDLKDGVTAAVVENISSYTVATALYKEAGIYYFYDGQDWIKTDYTSDETALNYAREKSSTALLAIWPTDGKIRDIAYNGQNIQGDDNTIYQEGEGSSNQKTVVLISDAEQKGEKFLKFKTKSESTGKEIETISFVFEISGSSIISNQLNDKDKTITDINSSDGEEYSISLNEDFDFSGWNLIAVDDEETNIHAKFNNSGDPYSDIEAMKSFIFNNKGEKFTFQATVTEQVIEKTATFLTCEKDLVPFGETGSIEVTFKQTKHSKEITTEGWENVINALSSTDAFPWELRGWLNTSTEYTKGEDDLYPVVVDANKSNNYGYKALKDIVFPEEDLGNDNLSFTCAVTATKKAHLNAIEGGAKTVSFLNGKTTEEYENGGGSDNTTVTFIKYLPEKIITDNWDAQVGEIAENNISSVIPQTDAGNLLSDEDKEIRIKKGTYVVIKNAIKTLLFDGTFPTSVSLKGNQKIGEVVVDGETVSPGAITQAGDSSIDASKLVQMSFNVAGEKTHSMFFANFGNWDNQYHLHSWCSGAQHFARYKEYIANPENEGWVDITIGGANDYYSTGYTSKGKIVPGYYGGDEVTYSSYETEFGDTKVYGKYDSTTKTFYWYSEAEEVYLNPHSSEFFCESTNLVSINFADLDASYVDDVVYRGDPNGSQQNSGFENFFYKDYKLNELIGLEEFSQTFRCGNYTGMFRECNVLQSASLDLINTTASSLVFTNMYLKSGSFTNISIKNIDIDKVASDAFVRFLDGKTNLTTATITFRNERTGTPLDTSYMFHKCEKLSSLEYGYPGGNTAIKYSKMREMFAECKALTSVNVGLVDITDMSSKDSFTWLFSNCNKLTKSSIVLKGTTANTLDCEGMFGANHANDGSGFVISAEVGNLKVSNAHQMFRNCYVWDNYPAVKKLDLSACTSTNEMFLEASKNLATTREVQFASDTTIGSSNGSLTDMSGMFKNCSKFSKITLGNVYASGVTKFQYMLNGCTALTNLQVSFVTLPNEGADCSYMFNNCSTLDFSGVNLSDKLKISKAEKMLRYCYKFSAEDIVGKLDLSSCTNVNYMFERTGYDKNDFDSIDLTGTSIGSVNSMEGVFFECRKVKTIKLPSIDVSSFTSNTALYRTFEGCTSAQNIELSLNASSTDKKATSCKYMFRNCQSLSSLNIIGFDKIKITSAEGMYENCYKLTNFSFLTQFDTSECTDMNWMLSGVATNQAESVVIDMSSFDTQKVLKMERLFAGTNNKESMIRTIYVSDSFVINDSCSCKEMFYNSNSKKGTALTGGSGTMFVKNNSAMLGKEYARVDNPPGAPGFFTHK
ncbi:MAG: BspA family leucine-rich repeat surface protein [Eubacterium sp.]|nr:BspA family leucine-rich repeat surface protein [Eubacterium sp.]